MGANVSVTRDIAASPDKVWKLVSDLPRMGEWSPETTGGSWIGQATGPVLGAQFKGNNKNGRHKWSTIATVVACRFAKEFEFEVSALRLKVARWRYEIEETGSGCKVTETFIDLRNPLVVALGKPISGVSDRQTHNRATMEATLANLAAASES